ncbi:MAG TPA: tetratricopeptide repeat protein [Burkholderiales bacterium]|nr:tetratricopeptide repeat protein [Burkholderiales bacterium]
MRLLFLLAALLAGCAGAPPQAPAPPPAPLEGVAPPAAPAAAANPAVERLMASARADEAASRLGSAEATLERALRIAPRDARLWQELARIRLQQGEYQQAESLAARSNTWAGADDALRAENWSLIAQARDARGDSDGARAALDNAERYRR